MDKIKIGKRIKDRRIALGLTQKEITDGFMTRNMLSLIEAGNALPSLETAEYIAGKLKISLSLLLSENEEALSFEKIQVTSHIRDLYAKRNYAACIEAIEKLSGADCEINYIYANASFELGKTFLVNGAFDNAEKYINLALEKSKLTIYNTDNIEASAHLYLSIASNIQSPLLELDTEKYENLHREAYDYELYKYLTSDFDFPFTVPVYKLHLDAKLLIRKYRYTEAIEILKSIEDSKSTDYNAFVLFGVYTDLETSYKQLGDFENAYRYSSKRFNLLNGFKTSID